MKAMRRSAWLLLLLLPGLVLTVTVLAQVSANYDLSWHLLSGGGGNRSSANYRVDDALGQWVGGASSGASYKIEPGFIYGAANVTQCYTLTLTHTGSGGDPVASPARSSVCAAPGQYIVGAVINLSASPANGWMVSAWSGTANDSSTSITNTLTMPPNHHTVGVVYVVKPDDYEVDNNCNQSHPIQVDGTLQEHTFHVAGDVDWVSFNVTQNMQYRIEAQVPISSTADVKLGVYPGCDLGATDEFDASFTPGVRLDFTAPASGPIYLQLSDNDPAVGGPNVAYRLSVRELQPLAQKGAVILLAGRLKYNDPLQPNITHVIDTAYNFYKQQGYTDADIFYLHVDPLHPGADQGPTVANLRNAITTWAVSKVGPQKPLIIYMMDHGDVDKLFVDEVSLQHITPADLDTWLDQLEAAVPNVKVTVVIEACYSGSFIDGFQAISKPGRVIITSTDPEDVAFASADGARFSDIFLTSLNQGNGYCLSFRNAEDSVLQLSSLQKPWIDANGNQVPNETVDCETADQLISNSGALPADSWAPYIVLVSGPDHIVDQRGVIQAQVRDNQAVARVWAVIYPPSYVPPASSQELVPDNQPKIDLVAQGSEMYSAEYAHFDEFGTYRIAIYAQDTSGLITGPDMVEVMNGVQVFMPILEGVGK